MIKKALFLVGSLLFVGQQLQAQQKEHIVSHNEATIVTNPALGANSYKEWAVFPKKDKEIRQIILNLTFECPDNMRCADWDYVDHIKVRPKNDSTSYEIARMLTPYGGRFQEDWRFDWKVDITDFSPILRDSLVVDYIHTGYEDNKTRGWKVTVDFEITYGKPVVEPLAVHKIYDGNYNYGDKNDPIENHLVPVNLKPDAAATFGKIKILQTGHGMDANGCGEFCDKYREILVDGKVIDAKQLWMECGDNPLYPQAGTWIFDRANWCPGYLLQPDEVMFDIKTGTAYTVNVDMEPYETENPSAKELLVAYVMEFGKINSSNDVTLVDIISPSTEEIFSRKNPLGSLAVIRIRNNGSENLKSLVVKYGLEGQKTNTFKWKGDIPYGESALISLPKEIYSDKETVPFHVELKNPNGKKDGYKADNKKSSQYTRPNILPENSIIYFKTNNKPGQNSYKVTNSLGDIVFKKDSLELQPNTVYRDTLQLPEGSYTFTVEDKGGDGLEFWYKAKDGRGDVKLLDTLGRAIKHFNSDFGSHIRYDFRVKPTAEYHLDNIPSITMFPSRTEGPIILDYFANDAKDVQVIITQQEDESKIVENHSYIGFQKGILTYDLSYLPKMRYYLKVIVDGEEIFKNRIRLKE
ncbi:Peptide-N-glycosidase F, C terminal [Arenibacter nanhaiticus]|uniref:Peptide-N-glycosidase F, C terminal n=1 Tax=Arenibacter nanhaiticus TaxID=558155 RepID=A0A1M6CVJ0_9FLAO|nr:peptide-N-glycosidase F-related protein [Arenibacter nanhaiticus]SHI65006.1 Peptide-N-glycosidase F, C terminal [Arenibacter nanhaiticus]